MDGSRAYRVNLRSLVASVVYIIPGMVRCRAVSSVFHGAAESRKETAAGAVAASISPAIIATVAMLPASHAAERGMFSAAVFLR